MGLFALVAGGGGDRVLRIEEYGSDRRIAGCRGPRGVIEGDPHGGVPAARQGENRTGQDGRDDSATRRNCGPILIFSAISISI